VRLHSWISDQLKLAIASLVFDKKKKGVSGAEAEEMCRLRYSFAKTVWRFGTKTAPPRCFPMFIRKGRNTTLFGQIGLTKIGVIVMMTNKKAVASGLVRGPMAAMDWSLENA